MTLAVTPTQDDIFAKLGGFVQSCLTLPNVPVVQLPINRVAMPPPVPGFVGMRIALQGRIMTNIDSWDTADPAPTILSIQQSVKLTVQLDCYSADAHDWAIILSTVLRDEYAVAALSPILAPLYTRDPRLAPLVTGEEEYERRYIVDAVLQYNPVISVPQQFANTVDPPGVINVEERYPPS